MAASSMEEKYDRFTAEWNEKNVAFKDWMSVR